MSVDVDGSHFVANNDTIGQNSLYGSHLTLTKTYKILRREQSGLIIHS